MTTTLARRIGQDDDASLRESARPLFRSFWMGGYEGADHVNSRGIETKINVANGHWSHLDDDYRRTAAVGIRTIRESIGWRASVDRDGRFDATQLLATARSAQRHGLQVVWTIHHYGVPDGVDFFADDFAERFADFCGEVARVLAGVHDATSDEPLVFQPLNEISFLSWALAHSSLIHPYREGGPSRAFEAKRNLVRATLRGCDAIRAVAPSARLVHNDPVIHVIATDGADDPADDAAREEAARLDESQFEAWDMLCGRRDPELGGHPRYLDVIGINYYHGNQWELPTNDRLHWHLDDPRRRPLESLVADVHARYGRPMLIAETSHVGDGRSVWLDDVASAAARCRSLGLPLEGVCLYPLIDRPDWEEPAHWHRSGLWDVGRPHRADEVPLERRLAPPYAARLRHWIDAFDRTQRGQSGTHATRSATGRVTERATPSAPPCLVVFSHLRWDTVVRRPQQLMSRLASRFRIVFVEEPVHGARRTVLERFEPLEHVEVLRPHVTGQMSGFDDEHVDAVRAMLVGHLANEGLGDCWLWFFTPMALPFAAGVRPLGIVYDCMDELAAFRGAAACIGEREATLLARADLVFTSGPGLFDAKRHLHPRVHCFSNSVDASRFAARTRGDDGPHPAQTGIAGPRLGYAGTIDERIDLDLIAAVADARPDWNIVVVGPIVKIDAALVPRRVNIHWLGPRDHAELPSLIGGWDVCLMPFARNDATRLINPTKTLEYLAADRPVVSTPVADVVASFGDVVTIAATSADFIAACADAIDRSPERRRLDSAAFAACVRGRSWDRTAREIGDLILQYRPRAADDGPLGMPRPSDRDETLAPA